MGQLAYFRGCLYLAAMLGAACIWGCDKPQQAQRPAGASQRTIASLVPAATDTLLQMNLGGRLVGISNYDAKLPELERIARVGDYHTVDWEKLTAIRPAYLIIPRQKQEIAPIFRERAADLGITLIDTHADRLDDVYGLVQTVGRGIGENARSEELIAAMRNRLDRIAQRAAGHPPVRVLIVMDEKAQFIVGSPNFLDDLLKIAGGVNAIGSAEKDYLKIDAEKLLELNPDAIIQFMPDAPPQVLEAARAFWKSVPSLKAVQDGRIYVHTDWYLLLPSPRVVDIAQKMVDDLHPLTDATQPATTSRDK